MKIEGEIRFEPVEGWEIALNELLMYLKENNYKIKNLYGDPEFIKVTYVLSV